MLFLENHPYRLRRIDLGYFKSVLDESVELGPLTVVVGANSSGKSTLLQAVLAVAQAVRHASPSAAFPLNGEFLELGSYRESRNFRASDQSEPITIGLGVVDEICATLGLEPAEHPNGQFQLAFRGEETRVKPSTKPTWKESDPGSHVIKLDSTMVLRESQNPHGGFAEIDGLSFVASIFDDGDADRESVFTLQSGALSGSQESELVDPQTRRRDRVHAPKPVEVQSGEVGCITNSKVEGTEVQFDAVQLVGGLPEAIFARRPCIDQYSRAWWRHRNLEEREVEPQAELEGKPEELAEARRVLVEQAASDVRSAHFGASGLPALDDDTRALVVRGAVDLDEHEFKLQLYEELKQEPWIDDAVLVPCGDHWIGEILDAARFTVRDVFGSEGISEFKYLGPLRQPPQALHDRGSELTDLGNDGRYAAEVLYRFADQLVRVPLPDGREREIQLGAALNEWLEWFGLAAGAAAEDRGRRGIGLKVRPEGAEDEVDLTAVGVGVSQALPVILVCLLTRRGEILILEQPELHLHPALQQRLADFFLLFVKSGRQILVETHSEHLVNRLRTQVAADDTNQIGELVKLLFAEQSEGITSYRESTINEYGGVSEDWPDGFLDLSAKSAQDLVRAHLQKRTRQEVES